MEAISTQKVNCKDCHRCVRACPVKAIAVKKGHAQLIDDKCVLCGKCVVECPQHAKQVEDQTDIIKSVIASGRQVVMSLAPSFVSALSACSPDEIIAAVYGLGFAVVEETAVGAEVVAEHYRLRVAASDQTVISACCPATVSLIKKYYPELVPNLAPVVSPMLAHGRLLKERFGNDCFVVFAGPCVAKIAEARSDTGAIDAVITFQQLRAWLDATGQVTKPVTGLASHSTIAFQRARLFPVTGGILRSAFAETDQDPELISVDGLRQCMLVFNSLVNKEISPRFIEALSCIGGCINGPAGVGSKSIPAKRHMVTSFAVAGNKEINAVPALSFSCLHQPSPITRAMPSENEIREILKQSGKYRKEDEKNCGACGYNSCRDNAIAVFQGLTEIDTCVPYMRTKAESFANIIVDNSLNAIIVLDENLIIQEFNPTAEQMFNRRQELTKGLSLTEWMECEGITAAIRERQKISGKRIEFKELGLVAEKMIVPVPEHRLVFLIFSDITDFERRSRELERMKAETVDKAKEIINKQMHVAQEIAGLLGETTAETKSALLELVAIMREQEAANGTTPR